MCIIGYSFGRSSPVRRVLKEHWRVSGSVYLKKIDLIYKTVIYSYNT